HIVLARGGQDLAVGRQEGEARLGLEQFFFLLAAVRGRGSKGCTSCKQQHGCPTCVDHGITLKTVSWLASASVWRILFEVASGKSWRENVGGPVNCNDLADL